MPVTTDNLHTAAWTGQWNDSLGTPGPCTPATHLCPGLLVQERLPGAHHILRQKLSMSCVTPWPWQWPSTCPQACQLESPPIAAKVQAHDAHLKSAGLLVNVRAEALQATLRKMLPATLVSETYPDFVANQAGQRKDCSPPFAGGAQQHGGIGALGPLPWVSI